MRVVRTREEVREWTRGVRDAGERTALVPTMGYLHQGHLSLVDVARSNDVRVGMSVFVNPLQFAPTEDFERYPRDLDRDLELARSAGVDLVFAPGTAAMYGPGDPWIVVVPERGADALCGRSRPGHFRGVLTVVAKLFGIFDPDIAVFGQKDYQQLTLIRRMVEDLEMRVEIRAGAIVRDPDGLALSSRNRYLSDADRARALALVRALRECDRLFQAGERNPAVLRERMHRAAGNGVSVEYGEVVHPTTLEPVESVEAGSVCAIAASVGGTRLIDNLILGSGALHQNAR
jgi:pantoate--beta-alanine ligase